jgi:hypothetical protein
MSKSPKNQGRDAWANGKGEFSNPFKKGTENHADWMAGFYEAQEEDADWDED